MKLNKSLAALLEKAKETDSYWIEKAKLAFSVALSQRKKARKMTSSDIAEKIGKSEAYVSKVFRGDQNFTIETMVKLARATGGTLEVRIVDIESSSKHWSIDAVQPKELVSKTTISSGTVTYIANYKAANQDNMNWANRLAA